MLSYSLAAQHNRVKHELAIENGYDLIALLIIDQAGY